MPNLWGVEYTVCTFNYLTNDNSCFIGLLVANKNLPYIDEALFTQKYEVFGSFILKSYLLPHFSRYIDKPGDIYHKFYEFF